MVFLWRDLERCREEVADAKEMLSDPGKEIAEMEIPSFQHRFQTREKLRVAMLPPDPRG